MKKKFIFTIIILLLTFLLHAQTDSTIKKESSQLSTPLLLTFHGSYAIPVGEYGDLISSSFKGGEIGIYYTLFDFSGLFLFLHFGINYMLHNNVTEEVMEDNLHLVGGNTGVSIMFHPSFTDKAGIFLDAGGGCTLSLLQSGVYDESFFSFDPTLFCAVGVRYRIINFMDIGIKATYKAIFYIYDIMHYTNISAGVGIYL